ncbi:hypothetical protein EPR50_G00183870 [Perca flavescens]|uniref:DDE Tnp4 domain-containing protein n=1 Tax=Perca flavescens TaxID=8167 RepID=A0A484C8F6_PERFV|nr:hypothetical protein EPR50_G00183870 [Perca flavescens]
MYLPEVTIKTSQSSSFFFCEIVNCTQGRAFPPPIVAHENYISALFFKMNAIVFIVACICPLFFARMRGLRRRHRRVIQLLLAENIPAPNPRQYCQGNNTVPLLALYFDGESDMRSLCYAPGHTAKFIDVFIGFPGSAHDARVLKHSPLYYQQRYPPPGFCIIGDGGYPCLRQPIALMTPYRQPLQNQLQVRFNGHLSRARCVVERAFGILKTRWRSIFLKALEVDVLYVPEVIACGTVLHNIYLRNGDLLEAEDYVEGEAGDYPQPAPQGAICGAEDRHRMAITASTTSTRLRFGVDAVEALAVSLSGVTTEGDSTTATSWDDEAMKIKCLHP